MGKHFHIEVEHDHDALVAMLAHLNGDDARIAIDMLINRLDALDLATNPDEPDFRSISDGLPGNPADAEPDNDGMGDVSWPEWHTRGRHKVVELLSGSHEPIKRADGSGMAHEDDEDDDPLEANGDEHDTGDSEEEELSEVGRYCGEYWYGGPGCPMSDGDERDELFCPTFGIDQTRSVSEGEAFHDLNGIPLIRVPLPGNDQ